MKLRFGEVLLIRIPFHEAPGGKVRPAAVILDSGDDDVVVAPITSKMQASRFDLTVVDWQGAGLNVPSWIRVHKLTVLAKVSVVRTLGLLADQDRNSLEALICRAFCPEPKT